MYRKDEPDYKRLFLAIFLAAIVLIAWQALVEWPRRQQLAQYHTETTKKRIAEGEKRAAAMPVKDSSDIDSNTSLTRQQRITATPRVSLDSDKLHGSINLKGARFDDVTLSRYREKLDPASPPVTLLSPNGDPQGYFAQIGWLAADGKTKVPDQNTQWEANKNTLAAGDTVTLRWTSGENVTFVLAISLDRDYMFSVTQRLENHSGRPVSVVPYAFINRTYVMPEVQDFVIHEGPLGVMENTLEEISFSDLRDQSNVTFDNASGWFGISDKYWLAALIPGEGSYKTTFSHYSKNNRERFQTDYLGQAVTVNDGGSDEHKVRLFAGAKEIDVLDRYAAGDASTPPIPLFDRSVDFGSLYFLTKPMLLMLNYFYAHFGNFGIAIMLLTIVVKLLMYPLANKSYKSISQMRALQPEMTKIRERYFDDQIALNKEMMALYKREKVNPASGCLPVLIQMPVFFALYKVLYVAIEMRHAPFFGWIRDLSVADPSNIFTGFGLLDWSAPVWLHLGVLPITMCATMIIQMRQQPKPTDPVQAKVIAWMPYFLLIIFAKMPAGLVLYWTWSNILSIFQQHVISKRYERAKTKSPKVKAAA